MKRVTILIITLLLLGKVSFAQQERHRLKDTTKHDKAMISDVQMHKPVMNPSYINSAFSLNLPIGRNGSGTGWLPDASPTYGTMYHSKNWMYMLQGSIFVRYNNQDFSNKGSRGDDMIDAPNWLRFMGQRKKPFNFSKLKFIKHK